MVHTLCKILVPVGNSTWLLGQILVLSVSNTVMYYKLTTSISLEPSRMELKRRLDFMVVHHTLCENLVPVGNSTWLLGQILVLSVSNTVMYYKLVTSISLEPSLTELKRRLDFMVVHYGPHCL